MVTQIYRNHQQVRQEISTWTRHLGQRLTKGVAPFKNHTMIMIPLKDGRGLANGNRRAAWLLFSKSKNDDELSRCYRIFPVLFATTVEAPFTGTAE